eukprot:262021-Amphidinium_carterae.1
MYGRFLFGQKNLCPTGCNRQDPFAFQEPWLSIKLSACSKTLQDLDRRCPYRLPSPPIAYNTYHRAITAPT